MNQPTIPAASLVKHQQLVDSVLQPAYTQFLRLVKARGFSTGVEVGVGFGGHCQAMLEYRGIESLTGVDPYTERACPPVSQADAQALAKRTQDQGSQAASAVAAFSQKELDQIHDIAIDRNTVIVVVTN